MEYRTILSNDTERFVSENGSPVLDQYEYGIDKQGRKILRLKEEKDKVYEKIQSFREQTDINNIMARFALGDENVLNVNKGFYIDATVLPSNIFEVYDAGLKAEQYFDGLPVDLKELFNNSYTSFMLADEKEFYEKVSIYNKKFENHQFDDIKDNGEVQYNE